jgi:hypothetical protein
MCTADTPSFVDPNCGYRFDPITGVVTPGAAGGVPHLEER